MTAAQPDLANDAQDWEGPHPGHAHDRGRGGTCSRCYAYAERELVESMRGEAGAYKAYDAKAERAKREAGQAKPNKLGAAFSGWCQ